MHYLRDLQTKGKNYPSIVAWCDLMMQYLQAAVQDVRLCLLCYADITRTSLMIYLILANKTKDGFDFTNPFLKSDGTFKTIKETKQGNDTILSNGKIDAGNQPLLLDKFELLACIIQTFTNNCICYCLIKKHKQLDWYGIVFL